MRLGDLDDLKVHISELMLVYSGTELNNAILNAINNASTVDPICPVDFPTEDDPYPVCPCKPSQGKWIKVKEERMSIDMSGEIVTRYKCSECGRLIAILPSKLADYPFCHCGAEMKKGGAV